MDRPRPGHRAGARPDLRARPRAAGQDRRRRPELRATTPPRAEVDLPTEPLLFTKFTTAIVGPGEAITWDPALTDAVDYEAELAVVIGRRARGVSVEDALDHVFGYTCLNDVSARDLQFADGQWVRAKSLDTFCPMGLDRRADELPTRRTSSSVRGLAARCSSPRRLRT